MDQQLQELKTKLAQLKGEQPEQQQPAEVSLAEKEERDLQLVRAVFASMRLSPEEIEADTDERVAKVNAVTKACPACYKCQPIANVVCDLCGHAPERWLPGEERPPRQNKIGDIVDKNWTVVASGKAVGAQLKAHQAQSYLRWAATSASSDELKDIVSRTPDPGCTWKIRHAANILRLRGKDVPQTFWGEDVAFVAPVVETNAEQAPGDPPSIDFAGLLAHYDRKLAEISKEQTA
jgi:hypothetical protein